MFILISTHIALALSKLLFLQMKTITENITDQKSEKKMIVHYPLQIHVYSINPMLMTQEELKRRDRKSWKTRMSAVRLCLLDMTWRLYS